MKTSRIERVEKVLVLLEEDVDFTQEDLVPDKLTNGKLFRLSKQRTNILADENKFKICSWSGFYDPETRTLKAQFERDLFI